MSFVHDDPDFGQLVQIVARQTGIAAALAHEMLDQRDVAALPLATEPALQLVDSTKRQAVEQAFAIIAPMYWGPRISLDEACEVIRAWVVRLQLNR